MPVTVQICAWLIVCSFGLAIGFLIESFSPKLFNILVGKRKASGS